jgi:hypothetical protein
MRSRFSLRPVLAALLITTALGGCETSTAPVAPDPLLPEAAPSLSSHRGSYHPVAGTIPQVDLQSVIGPEGGTLGVKGFFLTVPRGAVSAPTVFTFRSHDTGIVAVTLTASTPGSARENDVGEAGFTVPLTLSLSYDPAGGMPRWSRLVVAWIRPDGTLEPVPSAFNPVQRLIVGRLSHFSQYTLASN